MGRPPPICEANSAHHHARVHATLYMTHTLNKGVWHVQGGMYPGMVVGAVPRRGNLPPKNGEGPGPWAQGLNCQKKENTANH